MPFNGLWLKILVYTFRTAPFIADLRALFWDVVVLDKIKQDLLVFTERIERDRPDMILGIARSEGYTSTLEKYAVNNFHRRWKVLKDVKEDRIELDIETRIFPIREHPTVSYCNYSMFYIQSYLLKNNLNTRFMFVHIVRDDIEELRRLISKD